MTRNDFPPRPAPVKVGDPATVKMYSDSYACVVTRVTPKTVTVAKVETENGRQDTACDPGAWGVLPWREDGILDQPIEGTEQRFTLNKYGRYTRGDSGLTLILGHSTTWIDYRR